VLDGRLLADGGILDPLPMAPIERSTPLEP
jgi:predicted acylesterase/phospholipase RssA